MQDHRDVEIGGGETDHQRQRVAQCDRVAKEGSAAYQRRHDSNVEVRSGDEAAELTRRN